MGSENGKITWSNIEVRLGDLKPWARNPRLISDLQAERLEESFSQFGQVETIAIGPNGEVYNGHQRLKVLLEKHGSEYKVDARIASRALNEKEREKLTVFLHKGAAGDWNFEVLEKEFVVSDLLEWGFDDKELTWLDNSKENPSALLKNSAALQEKWKVQPGDLWKIGNHRLLCDDCTKLENINRVIEENKIGLVITDPPYNIGFDYWDYIGDKKTGEYKAWCEGWFEILSVLSPIVILTIGYWNLRMWFDIAKPLGTAIWIARNKTTGSKIALFNIWDPILIYGEKVNRKKSKSDTLEALEDRPDLEVVNDVNQAIEFIGRNNDIFEINNVRQEGVGSHLCPKQLSLIQEIVRRYSEYSQAVLDIFLGSGTTMLACQNLGRVCFGIEISPEYCSVILERMSENFPAVTIERIGN